MGCAASSVELDVQAFDDFITAHHNNEAFCRAIKSTDLDTRRFNIDKATADVGGLATKLAKHAERGTLSAFPARLGVYAMLLMRCVGITVCSGRGRASARVP